MEAPVERTRGRHPLTSRDEVSRTALALFAERGFEQTTLTDVAVAVGVGRRTLFRYFDSKNDMVWGNFEGVLVRLRSALASSVAGEAPMETLARAVIESNHYEGDALDDLRQRMTMIITVPALQAHSMVRYAEWRQVVEEFVCSRMGLPADALLPTVVGHMALAASTSAFAHWVAHPEESLDDNLRIAYDALVRAFG